MTITPSGEEVGIIDNISQYIDLINFESVIIGKDAGINIYNGLDNDYNVFVGTNSGKYSEDVNNSILIGWSAGMNIISGQKNIIIGNDNNYDINNLNNMLSIGYDNNTKEYNITIGYNNNNNGINNNILGQDNNIDGYNNNLYGKNNILAGNSNNLIGINNNIINISDSIIIGNDNVDIYDINKEKIIILGNNNIKDISRENYENYINSKPIHIGYDLYNNENYIMNIGNTIIKYNDYNELNILLLGLNNKEYIGIGYSNIENISEKITIDNKNHSMYINNGLLTDYLSILNNVNKKVTLLPSDNLNNDITYILPNNIELHDDYNYVLSIRNDNELYWVQSDILKVNVKSTDDIVEGINKFYTEDNFNNSLSNKTLDNITNGINNKYIINNTYDSDLYINGLLNINNNVIINGELTVNKLKVLGNNSSGTSSTNNTQIVEILTEIQSLKTIVENQQNKIAELESQLSTLV
tara:strand:+ start:7341 stop:8750 length:1410 start_codon:yes stop_codon:yes gene_type:complete